MEINVAKKNIFTFLLLLIGVFQGTAFSLGRVYKIRGKDEKFIARKHSNFEFKNRSNKYLQVTVTGIKKGAKEIRDYRLEGMRSGFFGKKAQKAQSEIDNSGSLDIAIKIISSDYTKRRSGFIQLDGKRSRIFEFIIPKENIKGKTAYLKWVGQTLVPQRGRWKGLLRKTESGWSLKNNIS